MIVIFMVSPPQRLSVRERVASVVAGSFYSGALSARGLSRVARYRKAATYGDGADQRELETRRSRFESISRMSSIVLLPASFAILLAGALLFTNAIEWFGSRLELGQGAVGSLLAAVATALPESLIPVVAIIEADAGADEVAIGAILGAPLLLATIAMALVGVAALIYRDRRPQRGLRAASTSQP
jgi:hypothetical protein